MMNVVRAINRLGLHPLNTMLVLALTDNSELRPHWSAFKFKKNVVLTVETQHIESYMLYYGTEDGHYVVNTRFGPARTAYAKTEYLELIKQNKYLTVVTFDNKVVYGALHNGKVKPGLYYKIALEVDKERDSQKKRLYRWQHWYDQQMQALSVKLTPKQVKQLVFKVLGDYSVDLSRVQIADSWNQRNKKAIARHIHMYESKLDHSTFMMLLYEFNNTDVGTVLHEIAHSLVLTEYAGWKGPVAGHGPEYCLILAELFHRYANIPIEVTYNSMTKNNIKVAPIADFFDGKKYIFYRGL